jgi:hypothetical protein
MNEKTIYIIFTIIIFSIGFGSGWIIRGGDQGALDELKVTVDNLTETNTELRDRINQGQAEIKRIRGLYTNIRGSLERSTELAGKAGAGIGEAIKTVGKLEDKLDTLFNRGGNRDSGD